MNSRNRILGRKSVSISSAFWPINSRYRDRLIDTRNGYATLPNLCLLIAWSPGISWLGSFGPGVVNYHPRHLNDLNGPGYLDYCRVRLMLHHPFVDGTGLLSVDSRTFGAYINAFRSCNRLHTYSQDFYMDLEVKFSLIDFELDPPENTRASTARRILRRLRR